MRNLTRIITRFFLFSWFLQFGVLSYGQGQLVHYKHNPNQSENQVWSRIPRSHGELNKKLLVDYWMNVSYDSRKTGYLHIDDQLASDQNIYLTYIYESSHAKASFGFSMNNNHVFSIKYHHAFSVADWFKL